MRAIQWSSCRPRGLLYLYSSPLMLDRWNYCNRTATAPVRIGTQLDKRRHGAPGFGQDKACSGMGVPRPVLVSGLIWALWHLPLILAGIYAAGPSPAFSAVPFVGSVTSIAFVFARMRLETGSIWPVIFAHSAWNSIIQGPFDGAAKGPNAALWTGELGMLTVVVFVVIAVLVSRGTWIYIRRLPDREVPLSLRLSQHPARVT